MRRRVHASVLVALALPAAAWACSGTSFTTLGGDGGSDGGKVAHDSATTHDTGGERDTGRPRVDAATHDAAEDHRVAEAAPGHDGAPPAEAAPRPEAAPPEAGPPDARSPDVRSPDASSPDARRPDAHEEDAGRDARSSDASKDAGEPKDATVHDADAGPPCATKTTVNQNTSGANNVFLATDGPGPCDSCGLESNACATLDCALAQASAGVTIYVAQGTYTTSSTIALPEGVSVIGGWTYTPGVFHASCDPSTTPELDVTAPTAITVGAAASPSGSTVTIDTVNITNTWPAGGTAGTGESLYGILAVGNGSGKLVLNDVQITVPAAASGAPGSAGVTGANGSGGCTQTNWTGTGATGTAAAPGGRGTYGPSGYTPVAPGTEQAATGQTGATPAPVQTCATEMTACPENVTGPAECVPIDAQTVCAGQTDSDCGGLGGSGGYTGGGGGSSIALYLWDEGAVIQGGTFEAGSGGQGGQGGAGGGGGQASSGGPLGQPASYVASCVLSAHTGSGGTVYSCVCSPGDSCNGSLTSAPGGDGYPGGQGGGGSGGMGGDSYAYYLGGGAGVMTSSSPVFSPASPGAGGSPGSPNGSGGGSGYAGDTNTKD
jgi:hypothetical protein